MFFCEPCRIKNKFPKNPGWPFMGVSFGRCEICRTNDVETHDVPSSRLVPKDEKSETQKAIERTIQQEFHRKSDDLIIAHVYGPYAGRMDIRQTELLRQIVVKIGEEIDWKTTYELRLKAQQGHYRQEEIKRDRN